MTDGERSDAGGAQKAGSFEDDTTTGWTPPPATGPPSSASPTGPAAADTPPPWPFQSVLPPGVVPPGGPGDTPPGDTPPGTVPPGRIGGPSGSFPPPSAGAPSSAAADRTLSRSGLSGDQWRDRAGRPEGPGAGPIVFGLLLILGGGFLLVRELNPGFQVTFYWPHAVVVLGVVLIVLAFVRPPRPARPPEDDRGWR